MTEYSTRAGETHYATVTLEKVHTSVSICESTKTITESVSISHPTAPIPSSNLPALTLDQGTTRTVVTSVPTTIRITEKQTVVKHGPTVVSTVKTTLTSPRKNVTVVSTRPGSTVTRDVVHTSVTTFTKGETITNRYTTTVLESPRTVTKVITSKVTDAAPLEYVTTVVERTKTTTAPGKHITVVSRLPASTITRDKIHTSVVTLTKGETVTTRLVHPTCKLIVINS